MLNHPDEPDRYKPWQHRLEDFIGISMISQNFAIDGRADEDYEIVWTWTDLSPPLWSDGRYCVREMRDFIPEGSVVLQDAMGRTCGFYMGGQAWIDPDHRGKGLSTRLILASAEILDCSPTAMFGGLGFTEEGYAAHVAAHRQAVQEAIVSGSAVPDEVREDHMAAPAP